MCRFNVLSATTIRLTTGPARTSGAMPRSSRGCSSRRGHSNLAFPVADTETGEVMLPETEEVVAPQFLGGPESEDEDGITRRQQLADWLTSGDNRFFARATVNRVWAVMFGRGIVDPMDDLGAHNPASHPKLLDDLAGYFVATGFDLRRLIRTLALTEAYQRSSRVTEETENRPELFARMAMKTMTAEQLYDCLTEAMRRREASSGAGIPFVPGRGFDQSSPGVSREVSSADTGGDRISGRNPAGADTDERRGDSAGDRSDSERPDDGAGCPVPDESGSDRNSVPLDTGSVADSCGGVAVYGLTSNRVGQREIRGRR